MALPVHTMHRGTALKEHGCAWLKGLADEAVADGQGR